MVLNDPEAVPDAWEDLILEEENEQETDQIITSFIRFTTTKRMRPQGQTEEKREAWDRETKDIRNAKARERRMQKKLEAQRPSILTENLLIQAFS
jgi:hypothetical protein